MDPTIVALATSVLSVLGPFASKGTEEFASKVGDATFEKAKAILATLKHKWSGDKEASDSLKHFEEKPQRYQSVLQDILQEKLSSDKDLAEKLSYLLQEMGPDLEVIQRMDQGTNITGADIEEMEGKARVSQDIGVGEGVTGAKVKRLRR